MNEMVERVARAIWDLNEDTDCHDYDQLTPRAKQRADEWARAAIQAMRVPTQAMVDRYMDLESMLDYWPYNPPAAIPAWQAMIDEALK